jgi:hypothetical protein
LLSRSQAFILAGSLLIAVFGFLAALVPAFAYATVFSYFMDTPMQYFVSAQWPSIQFAPFEFSFHMYSLKFLVAAVAGLIGLFAFARKRILPKAAAVTVALTSLSLVLGATYDLRVTIPEAKLFDVLSIGGCFVVVGLALVFLGVASQKNRVSRWIWLTALALLALYSLHPLMLLGNYLPRPLFADRFSSLNILLALAMYAVELVMIWIAFKTAFSKPNSENIMITRP